MTTLDRVYPVMYFRSYGIVAICITALFIVIDLFTHLDDFMGKSAGGFVDSASNIVSYYGYRVPQLFELLSEFYTLCAGAFTVAWMQRSNELLPQLSAGIPTRRAVRPVLLGAFVTLALNPLNQEFLIPEVADELMKSRDDPDARKAQVLMGAYEPNGIHIEGFAGFKKDKKVQRMDITFPENSPSGMVHITALEAVYVPPGDDPLSGGWLLTGVEAADKLGDGPLPTNLTQLGTGRYFLKVQDANYEAVCRGGTWYVYASNSRLKEMLVDPEPRRRGKMAVLFHMRMTRPLIGAVLVLLGLSVILANPNRHVIISSGICLGVSASLQLTVIACKYLGDQDILPAPLAAWLPLMIYGPMSLVAFDSIHT
jgi:lipopolysaccharide export system permease protein